MANPPTCCCCFSLRTAALLQIVANIIVNIFSLFASLSRAWVAFNAGDFQFSSLRVMPFVCLAMLIVGLMGAWKRKANYIRISALYELAMFIYHTGDLVYDFMTTTVADICKEQFANKHSTDPESVEAFCDSPLFFFFFVLVFVCMTGPFVLLDLMLVITLYRYALYITNQEYHEQLRYALPNEKSEGVSSAPLTTRIFLRKRANQSIADNQEKIPTV